MKDQSLRSFNWQETSPTPQVGTTGGRQSRDNNLSFGNAILRLCSCVVFLLSAIATDANLWAQSGFASQDLRSSGQVQQLLGTSSLPSFPQTHREAQLDSNQPSHRPSAPTNWNSAPQGTELRAQATLRAMPANGNASDSNSLPAASGALPIAQPSWNQPSNQTAFNQTSLNDERQVTPANLDTPSATPASYVPASSISTPMNRNSMDLALPKMDLAGETGTKADLLDQPINLSSQHSDDQAKPAAILGGKSALITNTVIALMIVMVLIVGCAWLFKKAAPTSMQALPSESIQVLGNAPLTAKQHLKLVRLGNRLLLLAVSETQSQTLAEVSDPDEVNHLLEIVKGKDAHSAQQTFRSLLSESEQDRATGFLGSQQDRILSRDTPAGSRPKSGRATRPTSLHSFEA